MIAYLEGDIERIAGNKVIIKAGGVGYAVLVSPNFAAKLHQGTFAKLQVYTQVREDILALYGFESVSELDLFELLLTVSGIGPKAALGILSAATPDQIKESIVRQDPSIISTVSGVGKKTASKVVLELKNKIGGTGDIFENLSDEKAEDVYLALINLGYKPEEARGAMSSLPKECATTEEKLKYCLTGLKKK